MRKHRSEENTVKNSIWRQIRKNPKSLWQLLVVSLLIIVPFCICLCVSYCFWNVVIGNDAYKYSDSTYEHIEQAIHFSAQKDIGLDSLYLQDALKHPEKPLINPNEPVDVQDESEPKPEESEPVQEEYSNPSNTIPKIVSIYENGQVKLVCSIKDGYFFLAEVTAFLTDTYEIKSTSRNFNSFYEYIHHYQLIFGLCVLGSTLLLFFVIEALLLGGTSLCAVSANKTERKKKEKEEKAKLQAQGQEDTEQVSEQIPISQQPANYSSF